MYAIIESGGKQFKVRRDGRIRVPNLPGEVGDSITFDRVLYASDGERVVVGNPVVEGARIAGEIVAHGRGAKVTVFKYKRRKRYRRKQGHRQGYTEVAITELELREARQGSDRSPKEQGERTGETSPPEEIGSRTPAGQARKAGPYVCEQCGRGFATERGLQQHRAKAHVE